MQNIDERFEILNILSSRTIFPLNAHVLNSTLVNFFLSLTVEIGDILLLQ